MTNTNTITAAADNTLRAQKTLGYIVAHGKNKPMDEWGAGEFVEMKLGRRTVYLVHLDCDAGFERVTATLFDSRRRLMLDVGICPVTGEFYTAENVRYNGLADFGDVDPNDLGWAAARLSKRVSLGHKRAEALKQYALDNEPELRQTLKALADRSTAAGAAEHTRWEQTSK